MKPVSMVNTLIQTSRKSMRYFPMVQAELSQIAEEVRIFNMTEFNRGNLKSMLWR
jgi:hypothetical protein